MFETRWVHGGSAVLRPLLDTGAVELLGGPVTHPILPLLPAAVASFALRAGLDDAALRVGRRPAGIWLPECAWSPELAPLLAQAGVRHFLVDEPTVTAAGGSTDRPWRVAGGDLVAVARDLALTDLVWSSRSGFPRGADYRDFYDVHPSGLRPSRVTDPARPQKQPYRPGRRRGGRPAGRGHLRGGGPRPAVARCRAGDPVAVVAWDTELFGHWWHEGPVFLEHVLRMLPEAGVRLATLGQVAERATEEIDLPAGSWGAGKDLRLWAGPAVADLAADGRAVADRLLDVVRRCAGPASPRRTDLDDLAREALLVLSSDWAFMVSRDSAAGYARERHDGHVARFHALADAVEGHRGAPRAVGGRGARVPSRRPVAGCRPPPRLRSRAGGQMVGTQACLPRCPVARLAVLLLFVAAFAPAAVMGALPLVLLTVVTVTAMLAAVVLALPQHEPVRAADRGRRPLLARPTAPRGPACRPCRPAPPGAPRRRPRRPRGPAPPGPGRRPRRCPAGTSPRTTVCAASTHPSPTWAPRSTEAFTPTHTSAPTRTGVFTIPWSLMGTCRSSNRWSKSPT